MFVVYSHFPRNTRSSHAGDHADQSLALPFTRPEGTTKEHDFICSGSSPAIPELCLRKVVVIYNVLINRSIDQSRYLPLIFFLTCITNELYAASAACQQYTPYPVGLWVLWSNEHGFRCSSHGVRIDHKIRILPRHHSPGIPWDSRRHAHNQCFSSAKSVFAGGSVINKKFAIFSPEPETIVFSC